MNTLAVGVEKLHIDLVACDVDVRDAVALVGGEAAAGGRDVVEPSAAGA